jgi:hypothetical protein
MNNVNEDATTDLDAAIAIIMSKSGATVEEAAEALMKSGGNVDSAIELIVLLLNETTFKTTFKSVESHNNAKSVPEYIDDDTCRQEKKSVDDNNDDDKKVATNQKNAGGAHNGTTNNTMNTITMETPMFANQRQRDHRDSDDTSMSETGTLSTDSSYTATTISSIIPEPPRPPRHQTSQPGAFRVTDIDGGSNENEEEDSVSNTTTRTPQSDPPVLAEVVNEDEENQRIRELIDREVEERERERMMEREGEIPEAEIVDMIEKNHCISNTGVKIWCGIAVLVLVMVTVAIILGTVLVPRAIMMDRASDDPPTSSPSRQEVLQELESLLSLVSFDNGTALQTPSTPQNMALNWLANNTNLDTYSDAKKIQRFALATLFYSTNGTTWSVNDTWMSNHEDECGWYNNGASLCTRGSIDRLNLEMNNLVGKIPNELALLSNLSESSVV